jgi:hypothetical protein
VGNTDPCLQEFCEMGDYHVVDLDQLAALGAPVDRSLFVELKAAEAKLPEPEPIWDEDPESIDVGQGLSISFGSRREGFETLRDIITRHRREWAGRFIDGYLVAVWQSALREAGHDYNRFVAEKGKSPTAKQFAKGAVAVTNHWFGGDLGALYTAIGEKSPVKPVRVAMMPHDRAAFARRVFAALGGHPFNPYTFAESGVAAREQQQEQTRNWRFRDLAGESLRYVQLEEALGAPPTVDQFGRRKFSYIAEEVWGDVDKGWELYTEAIDSARLALRDSDIQAETPRREQETPRERGTN